MPLLVAHLQQEDGTGRARLRGGGSRGQGEREREQYGEGEEAHGGIRGRRIDRGADPR
jgi:hypothetical protein